TLTRRTGETNVELTVNLDGSGSFAGGTGVGFFDHMLHLLCRHALVDLQLKAEGDLHVDAHHTVEDVGIVLGKALAQALGDKSGLRRDARAPTRMAEPLVPAAVALSGRPFLHWQVELRAETLGTSPACLTEEFWRAVVSHGAFNLHVILHHGRN